MGTTLRALIYKPSLNFYNDTLYPHPTTQILCFPDGLIPSEY